VTSLIYGVGYFVLMDSHRPTSQFRGANDYYESSFRWAQKRHASKGDAGPETRIPEVTVFNFLYAPLDKIFFRIFPRPDVEIEELRSIGYYQ